MTPHTTDHGIITRRALMDRGETTYSIRRAIAAGTLTRIRHGWYALPSANSEIVRAVRIGGKLTGASALALLGLWVMPGSTTHVLVDRHASRLRCPDDEHRMWDPENHPDIAVHWNEFPWREEPSSAVTSVATSVALLLRESDPEAAAVTLDSALNTRIGGRPVLRSADLARIVVALPNRCRVIAERADARAQSGLETLARVRLVRRGIRVRSQARIRDVGRVDVLIGDRFVLELDSRAHHLGDHYEEDRRRDLKLVEQGFLVLRVSYRRVMYGWESIERVILAVVRRGEHERSGMHERLGLAVCLD